MDIDKLLNSESFQNLDPVTKNDLKLLINNSKGKSFIELYNMFMEFNQIHAIYLNPADYENIFYTLMEGMDPATQAQFMELMDQIW